MSASGRSVDSTRQSSKSLIHLDGCHFYIWVIEHGGEQRLQWSERVGTSLYLHGDPGELRPLFGALQRCGAERKHHHHPRPGATQGRGKRRSLASWEVIAGDKRMIT